MLAEREVEAAAQELRVARVSGEVALVAVRGEADERVEVVALVEMEQHVAVVEVLDLHGREPRHRVLLDDGRRARGGRDQGQDQEPPQHRPLTPRL